MHDLSPRMDYTEFVATAVGVPAALQALSKAVDASGLEKPLTELIKVRASQINGCAFCIDMHWKDLRAAGADEQRLYGLDAWEESPYYSDRERAALAWTDSLTDIADGHVPDEVYDEMKKLLSKKELAYLTAAVVAINAFPTDTAAEHEAIRAVALTAGARAAIVSTHFTDGGKGAAKLAEAVWEAASSGEARYAPIYADDAPLAKKIETIATRIYGADAVDIAPAAAKRMNIPQSVGQEFVQADKGKKFGGGSEGRPDRQKINKPVTAHGKSALFNQGGHIMAKKMSKGGDTTMSNPSRERKGLTMEKMGGVTAGGIKKHGEHSVQKSGHTKGKQVVMAGGKGMKKGGKC